MITAQILNHPARNGGILVDHIATLRTERDELLAANEYQAEEIERLLRLLRDLKAERAHRPRAPWGPVVLAAIVGACVVIGLHGVFG